LLDAIGALLTTAFLLGILLPFEQYFGMPKDILYILSGISFCLFTYSTTCYFFSEVISKYFLAVIIFLNIVYSLILIGFVIYNLDQLTVLGLTYFGLEIIVIGLVVLMEYKFYVQLE
jgi:tryptophan-rich sensory protein